MGGQAPSSIESFAVVGCVGIAGLATLAMLIQMVFTLQGRTIRRPRFVPISFAILGFVTSVEAVAFLGRFVLSTSTEDVARREFAQIVYLMLLVPVFLGLASVLLGAGVPTSRLQVVISALSTVGLVAGSCLLLWSVYDWRVYGCSGPSFPTMGGLPFETWPFHVQLLSRWRLWILAGDATLLALAVVASETAAAVVKREASPSEGAKPSA